MPTFTTEADTDDSDQDYRPEVRVFDPVDTVGHSWTLWFEVCVPSPNANFSRMGVARATVRHGRTHFHPKTIHSSK